MDWNAFETLTGVEEFKEVVKISASLLLSCEMTHDCNLSTWSEKTFLPDHELFHVYPKVLVVQTVDVHELCCLQVSFLFLEDHQRLA